MTGGSIASFRPTWRLAASRKCPNLGERGGMYTKSVNYIVPPAAPKYKEGRFGELRAARSYLE
jgi:hypothetical protein